MDNPTTQEKIAQLRKSKTNVLRFKKNFIGGYSQDEVQAYIGSLSTNLEQSQRIYSEKLEELSNECAALSQEREKLAKQNRESAAEIKRLNARINALAQEQEAMLQKQKAAEDALQAARQSHGALAREHEALVSMNREAKKKAEEALANAETKDADVSKLSFENERQSALIKKLTREIEGLKQAGITKDDADLAKNFAKLRDANAQLLYENNTLKVSVEEQRKRADDFKEELAKQAEAVNALASAKRNHSMEMNMRLYKYKLQLDSHLNGAVSNLQEIEKFLESLKSDTSQMYESTKINIDL